MSNDLLRGDYAGWRYSAYYDLGPVTIPPKITFWGLTDRITGTVYYLGTDETKVVLSTTKPGDGVLTRIAAPYDGPYLAYGIRLFVSGASLNFEDISPERNLSGPVFLYDTNNPNRQTWPEPSFIPSLPPPTIPGIPSSTPPSTGGGYAAWVAAFPNNYPRQLTVILTTGLVKNVAMWNGTAWVNPAGTPLTGIL